MPLDLEPINWSDLPDRSGGAGLRRYRNRKEMVVDRMKAQRRALRSDYAAICQDYAAIRQDYATIRQDLQEIIRMTTNIGTDERKRKGREGMDAMKVDLPVFEGFDPMGWIAMVETIFETQGVIEEEKVRRAYSSMEGSAGYWVQAWKAKAKNHSWEGLKRAMVWRFGEQNRGITIEGVGAPGSAGGFRCTRSPEAPDWSIIESLILGNEIAAVEADCFWNIIAQNYAALDCCRKWHALLADYDRFKKIATAGGKLSPNFDYDLFEGVERVVRAREERGMADPKSDTNAGTMRMTPPWKLGPKEKGNEPKLEQRHEDNHEEKHEEKPFFSWVKREEAEHNDDNSEGVAEQVMSGVETVKVVDVATENQEEQRGLAIYDTPAEGRELLKALKDIEDHFLKAYDAGKKVTRMLEVNRIREEWKIVEEDLPPPKPPDLKLQDIGYLGYKGIMGNGIRIEETVREFLIRVPNTLLVEAVYLLNICPTKAVQGKSPIEAWSEKNPSAKHLRVFGYVVILTTQSKGYKVYNLQTKKLTIRRDIEVDESTTWIWEEEQIERKTIYIFNNQPTTIQEHNNDVALLGFGKKNKLRGRQYTYSTINQPQSKNITMKTLLSLEYIYGCGNLAILEPACFEEAAKQEEWVKAMKEEIKIIEKNYTWELVDCPKDKDIIELNRKTKLKPRW
ncbi:hypothetical protein V8G54_025045 [Vigna mungo]|uniref:Uncharacterized protein n=1 Tax=Vigna mungo TaxID=3915 RepID=A0AAQ3RQP0_VIGMU